LFDDARVETWLATPRLSLAGLVDLVRAFEAGFPLAMICRRSCFAATTVVKNKMNTQPEQIQMSDDHQTMRLLNKSPIGVIIVSKKGEFLFAHRRSYELLGVAPGTVLPNTAELYVDPARRAELLAKFKELGSLRDEEAEFKRLGDGGTF
jgi:hypothetical protein